MKFSTQMKNYKFINALSPASHPESIAQNASANAAHVQIVTPVYVMISCLDGHITLLISLFTLFRYSIKISYLRNP